MKVYPISIEVHDVQQQLDDSYNQVLVKMSCGCESEFMVVSDANSARVTDQVVTKSCERNNPLIPHEGDSARTNLLVLQAVVTKALMALPVQWEK